MFIKLGLSCQIMNKTMIIGGGMLGNQLSEYLKEKKFDQKKAGKKEEGREKGFFSIFY